MARAYLNKSVDRGLRVLDLFDEVTTTLTASEIAAAFDVTPATLYPTLCTLANHGYLLRDEQKNYRLGLKLLERSGQVIAQLDVRRVAHPHLRNLARERQVTADLATVYGQEVLYLERRVGHPTAMLGDVVGRRVPLHCTSLGKVLLAFMPSPDREHLVDALDLKPYTPHTIVDPDQLIEELNRIRDRGYAEDLQEFHLGSFCVAAPIQGHEGQALAAISLMLPVGEDIRVHDHKDEARAVIETAQAISRELGYNS